MQCVKCYTLKEKGIPSFRNKNRARREYTYERYYRSSHEESSEIPVHQELVFTKHYIAICSIRERHTCKTAQVTPAGAWPFWGIVRDTGIRSIKLSLALVPFLSHGVDRNLLIQQAKCSMTQGQHKDLREHPNQISSLAILPFPT